MLAKCFFVFFMTPSTTAQSDNVPPERHLRILFADDLPGLREVTRIALVSDGHAVECVADGLEAMERLSANPNGFDLLITDHHMPGKSGLELVGWLRTLPFPGKILVMTAEMSPDIGKSYRRLRVDGIVHKPVWPSELREAVAELNR